MSNRKYLTKSIFKLGLECPRKLFYHKKPTEYFDGKTDDPFLQALARGGYQVGMLAQLKYPNGVEIKETDYVDSVAKTAMHLKDGYKVLFEAAFVSQSYFVRSDIVIKSGNDLRIIEVKSKGFDSGEEDTFISPKFSKPGAPKIYGEWVPYIYDLAFQVFVARLNYPALKVSASMMLMDKSAAALEDGLHQYFLVKQKGKSKEVVLTKPIPENFKGHQLLKEIDLTDLINEVINGLETTDFSIKGTMAEKAKSIADIYLQNEAIPSKDLIGGICKSCEFRGQQDGLKSGFDECWTEAANVESASAKKLVLDLWNFRKTDDVIQNKKFLLEELDSSDLGSKSTPTTGRQLLQINLHKNDSKESWFDKDSLRNHINSWNWPLHFIDFETCMPAIPFKKNFPAYSEIAFQFSHHTMEKNGTIKHVGEFINLTPGEFPSFEFARELKRQLEKDNGTVFRYSNHENSVLNRIIFLLERSDETDKAELIAFLKTLTVKKASSKKDDYLWQGKRQMVDLLEITKECYLSPRMGGSNSLKYVLPSILNESVFLQEKYSSPIYGTGQITSINFQNYTWIKKNSDGSIADPYKELPPIFSQEQLANIESLLTEEEQIKNGGAAMMAYCKSQFSEMSATERDAIKSALLKYCELDTLAMVMLVEYWLSVV